MKSKSNWANLSEGIFGQTKWVHSKKMMPFGFNSWDHLRSLTNGNKIMQLRQFGFVCIILIHFDFFVDFFVFGFLLPLLHQVWDSSNQHFEIAASQNGLSISSPEKVLFFWFVSRCERCLIRVCKTSS